MLFVFSHGWFLALFNPIDFKLWTIVTYLWCYLWLYCIFIEDNLSIFLQMNLCKTSSTLQRPSLPGIQMSFWGLHSFWNVNRLNISSSCLLILVIMWSCVCVCVCVCVIGEELHPVHQCSNRNNATDVCVAYWDSSPLSATLCCELPPL